MSLLELIVKAGMDEAINERLGKLKGHEEAIAETIENNVRSKIIKEHLNDPAYYEKMSALLDEVIEKRRSDAIQYAEYLKHIATLVKKVEEGHEDSTPEAIRKSPGIRALFNNLKLAVDNTAGDEKAAEIPGGYRTNEERALDLAQKIDEAVKRERPDGWRGVMTREQEVKRAIYGVLKDEKEVERIFPIIKAQKEY
jgi:type I restriction enzyme R subunit